MWEKYVLSLRLFEQYYTIFNETCQFGRQMKKLIFMAKMKIFTF